MARHARAAVQVGERSIDVRELPLPEVIGPGEALLRVEANSVCGSDYEQYVGALSIARYPVVPGHEPVGRIEAIGGEAARAWHVREGDRVAVEAIVPCAVCPRCLEGRQALCRQRFLYGYTPLDQPPGLWGGFSEYLVLRTNSVVHPVPDTIPVEDIALFNCLAGGFEWASRIAGTRPGDAVLVLGTGQRGLACVIAAREAGADRVIVTGLRRDAHRLAVARELGATHTVFADEDDVLAGVREATDGEMVDRAIDMTPIATRPILDAIDAVRPGGVIVLVGLKGENPVTGLLSDRLVQQGKELRGAVGASSWAYRQAIRTIASGRDPLALLHSHRFTLDEVDLAIRVLGGEVAGEEPIHVTVLPS